MKVTSRAVRAPEHSKAVPQQNGNQRHLGKGGKRIAAPAQADPWGNDPNREIRQYFQHIRNGITLEVRAGRHAIQSGP